MLLYFAVWKNRENYNMEEIISIIENCDEFNDFVYEKLVSKYGKKNVD